MITTTTSPPLSQPLPTIIAKATTVMNTNNNHDKGNLYSAKMCTVKFVPINANGSRLSKRVVSGTLTLGLFGVKKLKHHSIQVG